MAESFRVPERARTILVVAPQDTARGGMIESSTDRLLKNISARTNFHIVRTPRTRSSLRQAVQAADLLWLHDTSYAQAIVAFRAARKWHKTILITQHSDPAIFPDPFRQIAAWFADHFYTQRMLKEAHQVTFTNDATADFYYRRVAFTAPVKIVLPGLDVNVFHTILSEKRRYLRARFALRDDQPVLLFAGALTNQHGMAILRHLAQLLPDWRFWLAGRGPVNPDKWFLPNVQTLRGRSGTTLAELYHAADLLVLPGQSSDFPSVFQEAMACGLPVMCSSTVAASSQLAKPHLMIVRTEATSPRTIALSWAERLKTMRNKLPLADMKMELAGKAQAFWEESQMTDYYIQILRGLCKLSS